MRKDGGIKLLDINEQPLGYAAAKKRKRQLELEEQQRKAAEAQAAAADAAPPVTTAAETPATPEYAQGLTPINPPPTPTSVVTTSTVLVQNYSATPPVATPVAIVAVVTQARKSSSNKIIIYISAEKVPLLPQQQNLFSLVATSHTSCVKYYFLLNTLKFHFLRRLRKCLFHM